MNYHEVMNLLVRHEQLISVLFQLKFRDSHVFYIPIIATFVMFFNLKLYYYVYVLLEQPCL